LQVLLSTAALPRAAEPLPAGTHLLVAYRLRDRSGGLAVAGGDDPHQAAAAWAGVAVTGVRFAAVSPAPVPAGVRPDDLLDGTVTLALAGPAGPADEPLLHPATARDYVIAVLTSGSPSMSAGIDTVEGVSRHRASVFAAVDPSQWRFLVAPAGGSVEGGVTAGDLVGVHHLATHTGRTEVHVLARSTRYGTWRLHRATPLAYTANPTWAFALGDQNADRVPDLVAVRAVGGASRRIEAHVLCGATGFTQRSLHAATGLTPSALPWQWSLQ
jgi:hypothetical protein